MDEPQMHRVRCGVPDDRKMIPIQIVAENFEQRSRVGYIQHDVLPDRPGDSIDWPEEKPKQDQRDENSLCPVFDQVSRASFLHQQRSKKTGQQHEGGHAKKMNHPDDTLCGHVVAADVPERVSLMLRDGLDIHLIRERHVHHPGMEHHAEEHHCRAQQIQTVISHRVTAFARAAQSVSSAKSCARKPGWRLRWNCL